jgi:hypothetical protein
MMMICLPGSVSLEVTVTTDRTHIGITKEIHIRVCRRLCCYAGVSADTSVRNMSPPSYPLKLAPIFKSFGSRHTYKLLIIDVSCHAIVRLWNLGLCTYLADKKTNWPINQLPI